jgi:hypothetical protein
MTHTTLPVMTVTETLDVVQRLAQLREWRHLYRQEDLRLRTQAHQLNPTRILDVQKGAQIAAQRRRLRLQLVAEPIEVPLPLLHQPQGLALLSRSLRQQFSQLDREDRILWLHNLLFMMTPALRQLDDKITRVRAHLRFGQQRNFLLGGPSGSGKTTYLDFLAFHYRPQVERERNLIPVIKIDAPVSNHTPKPLLQRMVLACGYNYLKQENEEELLMKLALFFQQCGVELLIVDEVEHLRHWKIRRRLLEVSNLTQGIPILCASCNPQSFTHDDPEIAGRWNDYYELPQYVGDSLRQLLAFVDLLLPFPRSSGLDLYEISLPNQKTLLDGPARLIEQYTGGILRDIMILVAQASVRAIERGEAYVTPLLLESAWRDIQSNQVTDFLRIVRVL